MFAISKTYALSCIPMNERVIGACTNGICNSIIYVREIQGYLPCARRAVVEPIPIWSKLVLEYELSALSSSNKEKIYELKFTRKYWNNNTEFKNIKDYMQFSEDGVVAMYATPEITILDSNNIVQLLKNWKDKESKEYNVNLFIKLADWLRFIFCTVAILFSVKWYRAWLLNKKTTKWFIYSLITQISGFTLAIISAIGWHTSLVYLLLSGIIIVWIYEIKLYSICKIRCK